MPLKVARSGTSANSPKQIALVILLALVLVGVGFWQWQSLSGGEEPKPNTASNTQSTQQTTESNSTEAEANNEATQGSVVASNASPRDPFRPFEVAQETPFQTDGNNSSKVVVRRPTPKREIQGNIPAPVLPLGVPAGEGLHLRPEPSEPAPPNLTVTGVVLGPTSVAIARDSEGNRRFLKQGDPLEEGWRVERIERGQITLVKGKQKLTIRVGQSSQESGGNES